MTLSANINNESYIDRTNVDDTYFEIYNKFIKSTNPELVDFIHRSIGDALSEKSYFTICGVENRETKEIFELTKIDISNYTFRIKSSVIKNHIKKFHGIKGVSDTSMSFPEDLARIEFILRNYDAIELLHNSDGTISRSKEFNNSDNSKALKVKFTKRIDGHYYVVVAVPESKNMALQIITAYIKKIDTPVSTENNVSG